VDEVDPLLLAEQRELADVEQHGERVLGRGRKRQPDAALGLQLGDQPAALGRDQRARADLGQPRGDVDGRALGAAGLELRDDLQHGAPGERMGLGRRQGQMRAGTQGGAHYSKGPSAWRLADAIGAEMIADRGGLQQPSACAARFITGEIR
jgi:hypothetical protein